MNILFTAGGRRVEIIEAFKEELTQDKIFVADVTSTAPALYVGHEHFLIPSFSDTDCLAQILEQCVAKKIDVIIPLIDPELDYYTQHHKSFQEKGIQILISSKEVVDIGRNKWETFQFFQRNEIPTITTYAQKQEFKTFPIVAKPIFGSAGDGVEVISNQGQFENQSGIEKDYIYQPFIKGDEITVDVISDGLGRLIATCQRKRLKTRAGEVERAVTMFDEDIHKYIQKIVTHLKPFGLINIQLYKDHEKNFYFQEINLRLGGGNPLTLKAGINIPKMLKQLIQGEEISSDMLIGQTGLYMLRYDQAYYVKEDSLSNKTAVTG